MNSDVEGSNVDNDDKNCTISIKPEIPVRHSVLPQCALSSSNTAKDLQLGNEINESSDRDLATFCCVQTEKDPQIHASRKIICPDKRSTEEFDKAAPNVAREPRNGPSAKQERKKSTILASDEKCNGSVSPKRQSTLKDGRDNSNCKFTSRTSKIFSKKAIRGKSSPKAKETCCKNILLAKKSIVDRTIRNRNEIATIDRDQKITRLEKYPVRANANDKVELNEKKINSGIDSSMKPRKIEKISAIRTVDNNDSMRGKTICNNDARKENDGAARTRIFQHEKRSEVDKNQLTSYEDGKHGRKIENPQSKFDDFEPPLEDQNGKRHKIENNKSIKNKSTQDSIASACDTVGDNVVSLFQRGLSAPKSFDSDSDPFRKFPDNYVGSIKERGNNNSTLDAGSGIDCNIASLTDIDVDPSGARAKNKNEKESITGPISDVNRVHAEMINSQTIGEVSSVPRGDITCSTDSIYRRYHSDQRYCKETRENRDEKYAVDTIIKCKNMRADDAKYNLMKALIYPANKIPHLNATDDHSSQLSESGQKSESISACRDEGPENCYGNSSSSGSMNGVTLSPSNDAQKLQNYGKNSESIDLLNPHASVTYFKQFPISNTSDYDATSSKMKGCKYTKKYRHFKYEEKKMYRNIARYIERMVSNERQCQQNSEKKANPEKEGVKIIIDQRSPKTSRISIVNDRSSVSVVCHSSRRVASLNERKNDVAANKAESSGGESSGYKSLKNSKTKHFDFADQVEVRSIMEQENRRSDKSTSHNRHEAYVCPRNTSARYETSEQFIEKANVTSRENPSDYLHEENLETQENVHDKKHGKRNTDIKFIPYDANKYLSPFTDYTNSYIPSQITAYQLNKVNGNKMLQFEDDELLEKDMDDAELRIGKYSTSEHSDSEDDLSEEKASSEVIGSVKDNVTNEDEIIVMKSSDNLRSKSSEMLVNQRFLNPSNAGARTDSTDVPATTAAQLKIIQSQADMKSIESTSERSSISMDVSDVKSETQNNISMIKVDSSNQLLKTNRSSTPIGPNMAEKVSEEACAKPTSRGISCFRRFKNKREILDDKNTVHELWANKKLTVHSTDNESQTCVKSHSMKSNIEKMKFNIFKKLSALSSEKPIKVSLDQLPKLPTSFLQSSLCSQSTILSSKADTESLESDDVSEPAVDVTSILPRIPATKFRDDVSGVNHTNTASNGKDNSMQFRAINSTSVPYEDVRTHTQPGTSAAHSLEKKVFEEVQERAAVPPPASDVPSPYPFCCPMAPYMMQHWQNYRKPPPASTVPLPEVNWKSNVSVTGSVPPPPGMVPIPWFPQMRQMNDTLPTRGVPSANNFYTQPSPEWPMMPRGYAPCLPCSKTPELHLKKTDSSIGEEDEPVFEMGANKQDGKKKTVSNKLFKIFSRKNKGDTEMVGEDERKGKNVHTRSEFKQIQKVRVEQNNKRISDDRSIWESPDIAGIVTPEEIGRCFRRGFRADGLTLSGDDYLCTRAPSDEASGQEDVFNFSEHDTPLDFLLALGFSVDEATAAIRDDEVRRRFKAALTEARIWVPHIATTQGTLLYLLAMKAKPKVMRYFLQLVESIVNKRITNAVKLDAYLKILEKVEDGYVSFVTLFGKDTGQEDEEDTVIVEKQRRRIFYTIYKYAEAEAEGIGQPLTKASVDLLHSLAARYRSAIGPHLRLLARYIGEGLLTKDVQLEAAVIYLSRLDSADVRLADLEIYCGLPPSERRRQEQIVREQSSNEV